MNQTSRLVLEIDSRDTAPKTADSASREGFQSKVSTLVSTLVSTKSYHFPGNTAPRENTP